MNGDLLHKHFLKTGFTCFNKSETKNTRGNVRNKTRTKREQRT